MTRTAIVAGAGIAGLSAAIALRNAGYDVRIYERAPSLEPMGAAISLWANAMAALDAIGVGETVRRNAAPLTGLVLGNGRVANMRIAARDIHGPDGAAFLPSRALIQQALLDALGADYVALGKAVERAVQTDTGVTVTLRSGETAAADLLVVADGIWSRLALAIGLPAARHAGYGGVLALSDEISANDMAAGGLGSEHWHYDDDGGERFGLFDLGESRRYWFYMADQNEAGAAAPQFSALRARAETWCPAVLAAIDATPSDRLIPFSIYAKAAPKRLGHGRLIAVGDAAHAMEPNLGQGACQALEDAAALQVAARIVDDPGAILPMFEKLRLARIRRFVAESRRVTSIVHGRSNLRYRLGRALLTAIPRAVTLRLLRYLHTMPDYDGQASLNTG